MVLHEERQSAPSLWAQEQHSWVTFAISPAPPEAAPAKALVRK